MKNLRRKFERFCFKHRHKGIPNLMLYIVLGCGLVTIFELLGYTQIYDLLCFDRTKILQGQIWRLFSYVFTIYTGNILTALIVLYCAYSLGRAVENIWGSFKFTLFYLFNIVAMGLFAILFGGMTATVSTDYGVAALDFSSFYSSSIGAFLHLSMVICYATLYPDTRFLLFYIIPIKAKIMSLFYLAYILFNVVQLSVPQLFFPHNLFPLVAMLGYFLFFGSEVKNLLPMSWQAWLNKRRCAKRKPKHTPSAAEPIQFRSREPQRHVDYTHKCTVCGRTDVSNPELEFRYCSRCNGYHCYCQDHISNHEHITE